MQVELFFQEFGRSHGLADSPAAIFQIQSMAELQEYPGGFTRDSFERYIAKLRKMWRDGDPRFTRLFNKAFSLLPNLKPPPRIFEDMWLAMQGEAEVLQARKHEREIEEVVAMKAKHELDMKRLGNSFLFTYAITLPAARCKRFCSSMECFQLPFC